MQFVFVGAGDFAVEVATYLSDISRDQEGSKVLITDIVSTHTPRAGDIASLLGCAPVVRPELCEVPELHDKQCVVCIGDPAARYRVLNEIDRLGGRLGSVIHPTAYVAGSAQIASGCIIGPMAFVGPFARLGRNLSLIHI